MMYLDIAALVARAHRSTTSGEAAGGSWTVLVYGLGDNNLEADLLDDLDEMAAVPAGALECVALVEKHGIGWAWWPYKKVNNPRCISTVIPPEDFAAAVCVPRSRFLPVKKCNDLLVLRSDCFLLDDKGRLAPSPARSAAKVTARYIAPVSRN